jgi:hypothetical protein
MRFLWPLVTATRTDHIINEKNDQQVCVDNIIHKIGKYCQKWKGREQQKLWKNQWQICFRTWNNITKPWEEGG